MAKTDIALVDIDLFSEVPKDVLAQLGSQCMWHRFPASHLVIDGELKKPHGVFILTDGEVEVYRHDLNSEQYSIGRLSGTVCFGEFTAILGETGSTSVRTITPCRLAEIPPETFVSLLNNYPSVSLRLLKRAISLVRALDEDLVRFRMMDNRYAEVYRKTLLCSL